MKPPRHPDPLVGSRLAEFEVEDRLGSGGMGVVYRARDTRLGRTVALKILPASFTGDDERQERFLKEARAASALDHPNIGTIHALTECADGRPMIVMAYYEGQTLHQRLAAGPMTLRQALDVAIQTAEGLAEAHDRGIVHRDIKPSNLILTPGGTVKILDFGLARIAGESRVTQTGTVMGTAAYMPPEQANGGPTDARSDVWSLGVVLYEMVTGQVPFPGDTAPTVLYAVVHHPPVQVAGLPGPLRDLIDRALAKNPDERFANGRAMAVALKEARTQLGVSDGDQTLTAVTPSRGHRRQGWRRSDPSVRWPTRRLLLAGAGVVLLLAVLALLAYRYWPVEERGLAVLPFSLVSGDAALADGLLETITSRLTEQERANQRLWVAPASEVRRRGIASAEEARKLFGVNYAITGSVQQNGPSLRLTINLVNTRTMRQVGSAVIDEVSGDYLRLQDLAIAKVADLLRLQVAPAPDLRASVTAVQYEAYLKGIGLLVRWDKDRNLAEAIQVLEGLAAAAPKFAAGRAALAHAFWLSYQREHDPKRLLQARDQSQEAAQLDPNLAVAHEILGRIHQATGKQDLAVLEYQEALRIDPRRAESVVGLARAYEDLGRPREAEETMKRAIALRPTWWGGYNSLGSFYYRAKRFPDAEAQFRKALELTPDNWVANNNLGNALKEQNRPQEALRAYEKAAELSNDYVPYQNAGALTYEQGEFRKAAEWFEAALKRKDTDYRVWGSVASALERAGTEPDKRRHHLQVAAEKAEALLKVAPDDEETQAYLSIYYAKLGEREKATAAVDRLAAKIPAKGSIWQLIAEAQILLGRRTEALRAVEMALGKGYDAERLQRDPRLGTLYEELKRAGRLPVAPVKKP